MEVQWQEYKQRAIEEWWFSIEEYTYMFSMFQGDGYMLTNVDKSINIYVELTIFVTTNSLLLNKQSSFIWCINEFISKFSGINL